MPADRRTMPTSTKPVKTERTHEENQERAYIAASRRSDRSLEARIESARRASEIHKKRTGRGLRVTEQDVINEEMYEEEDEDLPTQYQRLSAHLHTGSLMFNRKLHDYIATQHGVRNAFLQQYSNAPFSGYAPQVTPNTGQFSPTHGPQVPQSQHMFPMLPPRVFNNATQAFDQSTQPLSPTVYQQPQQNYRQSPYTIPQRPQPHRRSASVSTPQQTTSFNSSEQYFAPVVAPRDEQRRLSLPPQAIEQSPRPSSPQGTPSQGVLKHPVSPQDGFARASNSPLPADGTHSPQHENKSMAFYPFIAMNHPSTQVLNLNPLSLSLPPESQQFLGSTLDSNDPLTSIFMSGSEYITQPFGKYTYNPNVGSKASRIEQTTTSSPTIPSGTVIPAVDPLQLETALDNTLMSAYLTSAKSDDMMSSVTFTPSSYEFSSVFDGEKGIAEEFDDNALESAFLNADAWDNLAK